jgi:hypothetical protein
MDVTGQVLVGRPCEGTFVVGDKIGVGWRREEIEKVVERLIAKRPVRGEVGARPQGVMIAACIPRIPTTST